MMLSVNIHTFKYPTDIIRIDFESLTEKLSGI